MAAGRWAVSVLSAEQDVAAWFATRGRAGRRPVRRRWRIPGERTGAPLLDGALAWFECRTWATYDGGDHTIVVGEVLDLGCGEDAPGLLYFRERVSRDSRLTLTRLAHHRRRRADDLGRSRFAVVQLSVRMPGRRIELMRFSLLVVLDASRCCRVAFRINSHARRRGPRPRPLPARRRRAPTQVCSDARTAGRAVRVSAARQPAARATRRDRRLTGGPTTRNRAVRQTSAGVAGDRLGLDAVKLGSARVRADRRRHAESCASGPPPSRPETVQD